MSTSRSAKRTSSRRSRNLSGTVSGSTSLPRGKQEVVVVATPKLISSTIMTDVSITNAFLPSIPSSSFSKALEEKKTAKIIKDSENESKAVGDNELVKMLRMFRRLAHRAKENIPIDSSEKIELEVRLGVRPGKGGTENYKWFNMYRFVRYVLIPRQRAAKKIRDMMPSDAKPTRQEISTRVIAEFAAITLQEIERGVLADHELDSENSSDVLTKTIQSGINPKTGEQLDSVVMFALAKTYGSLLIREFIRSEVHPITREPLTETSLLELTMTYCQEIYYQKTFRTKPRNEVSLEPEAVARMRYANRIPVKLRPDYDMSFSQYVSHNMVVEARTGTEFRLRIDNSNIDNPDNQPWQEKRTIDRWDLSDYLVRMQVSAEDFTSAPVGVLEQNKETVEALSKNKRYISRHSFFVGNVRFDFSRVNMGGEITYEAEAEYIFSKAKAKDPEDIKEFIDIITEVLAAMYGTPILFTYSQYKTVSALVNDKLSFSKVKAFNTGGHIDRRFFSEAKTMTTYMINESFFKPDPGETNEKSYHVSLKVDGKRIFLIICSLGTWLIYPPFQATLHAITDAHKDIGLTIVDGELVDGSTFWFIDCLFLDGKSFRGDVEILSYQERRERFLAWRNNLIDISKATVPNLTDLSDVKSSSFSSSSEDNPNILSNHVVKTIEDAVLNAPILIPENANHPLLGNIIIHFKSSSIISMEHNETGNQFKVLEEVWNSRAYYLSDKLTPGMGFEADGLMFTPNYPTYNASIDSERRIIFKWKPNVTIDLMVKRVDEGYELFSRGEDKETNFPFNGTPNIPFKGRIVIDETKILFGENGIVEFEYVQSEDEEFGEKRGAGDLVGIKSRTEKTGANGTAIVMENWEVMVDPVTEDVLFCRNNVLERKAANRLKENIFGGAGGILIDIGGAGHGGTINKTKHFSKIIIIDVDGKAVQRYKDRLAIKTAKNDNEAKALMKKTFVIELGGQDTRKIKKFLIDVCNVPDAKVDCIAMMDSLTFFFGPDGKLFNGLVKTINTFLKEGGLFIWRTMDGDEVKKAMNEMKVDELTFGKVHADGTQDKIERLNKLYPNSDTIPETFSDDIGDREVKVVIRPKINQLEYFTNIPKLMKDCGLVGDIKTADVERFLSPSYRSLAKLYSYGTFTKGTGVRLSEQITKVFGITNIKEQFGASKFLISAVESLFVDKPHETFLSKYISCCLETDQTYFASGNEPSYTRFETANSGYWALLYLQKIASDSYKREEDILRENLTTMNGDDRHLQYSLCFCSLLSIDVVVLEKPDKRNRAPTVKYNKGSYIIKTTNVVKNSPNPCLIVMYQTSSSLYKVEKIENKVSPFYPFNHSVIEKLFSNAKPENPKFKELYYDLLKDGFYFRERIETRSNILTRLCFIKKLDNSTEETEEEDRPNIRLLCYANELANKDKACDSSNLEKLPKVSIDLVPVVNALIEKLMSKSSIITESSEDELFEDESSSSEEYTGTPIKVGKNSSGSNKEKIATSKETKAFAKKEVSKSFTKKEVSKSSSSTSTSEDKHKKSKRTKKPKKPVKKSRNTKASSEESTD